MADFLVRVGLKFVTMATGGHFVMILGDRLRHRLSAVNWATPLKVSCLFQYPFSYIDYKLFTVRDIFYKCGENEQCSIGLGSEVCL